jgi:alkane 1-monooxygenase
MSAMPFYSVLVIPASVSIGLLLAGLSSYLTIVVVFGLVPLLDALIGLNEANPTAADEKKLQSVIGYRLLTWFCAGLQVSLVIWGIVVYAGTTLTLPERLGLILSLGISSGGMGIVVSHELIHRIDNRFEPILGRIVLASVLYLHWAIEHIAGHHRTVATAEDPATARKNETYFKNKRLLFQSAASENGELCIGFRFSTTY